MNQNAQVLFSEVSSLNALASNVPRHTQSRLQINVETRGIDVCAS